MSSCVCKISFKSVQVCSGCCEMFRGLTFLEHSVGYIARWKSEKTTLNENAVILHRWYIYRQIYTHAYVYNVHDTHTHTRLTALFPGLSGWAGTRKVKPIWILLKQETVSGSGISWAICKSASRSRQITMPVLHYSSFLQGGCPFCRPNQQHQSTKGI